MAEDSPPILIETGTRKPIAGVDTLIAAMPEMFYAEIGGKRTLLLHPFVRSLRALVERQAENLGEELHHAEIVITTNPSTVQAKGLLHDCDTCRAGVRKALRALEAEPERELIVGVVYWAGEGPSAEAS